MLYRMIQNYILRDSPVDVFLLLWFLCFVLFWMLLWLFEMLRGQASCNGVGIDYSVENSWNWFLNIPLLIFHAGKNPTDEYLEAMMNEAPGPINFTMFLTMFGEKLNGTDPEDVIRNAFACFDEEGTGEFSWPPSVHGVFWMSWVDYLRKMMHVLKAK